MDLDLTLFNRQEQRNTTKFGTWIDFMSDENNSNMTKIQGAFNELSIEKLKVFVTPEWGGRSTRYSLNLNDIFTTCSVYCDANALNKPIPGNGFCFTQVLVDYLPPNSFAVQEFSPAYSGYSKYRRIQNNGVWSPWYKILSEAEFPISEGLSWTPTVFGSLTAGTPTYTSQVGKYWRHGSMIYITCVISVSNNGGMVGEVRFGGLPITPSSGIYYPLSCSLFQGVSVSTLATKRPLANSNNWIAFRDTADAGLQTTELSTGIWAVYIAGWYRI